MGAWRNLGSVVELRRRNAQALFRPTCWLACTKYARAKLREACQLYEKAFAILNRVGVMDRNVKREAAENFGWLYQLRQDYPMAQAWFSKSRH
jgi:hypothetical protein